MQTSVVCCDGRMRKERELPRSERALKGVESGGETQRPCALLTLLNVPRSFARSFICCSSKRESEARIAHVPRIWRETWHEREKHELPVVPSALPTKRRSVDGHAIQVVVARGFSFKFRLLSSLSADVD